MMERILMASLLAFSVSIAVFLYRAVVGPSMPDRIIAMDTIGVNLIAVMAILSVLLETYAFFEVILLLGILSFVSTIAFAKFIEKGVLMDDDTDR
ncbi:MAG TPA: Na(+)/H(+) antiporter subunit F1 [Clostridia bacterium]|nr:Na(+)/H(+) antiporter subunit F1 [Clostridia bacterium]